MNGKALACLRCRSAVRAGYLLIGALLAVASAAACAEHVSVGKKTFQSQRETERTPAVPEILQKHVWESDDAGVEIVLRGESDGSVQDAKVEALDEVESLRGLIVFGELSDSQLRFIGEHLPDLQRLRLSKQNLTPWRLRFLQGLTAIETVDLSHNLLNDESLQHLGGMSELRDLDLGYNPITDAGLQHLGGLSQLEDLNLSGTQVTIDGVPHLYGLPLQELALGIEPARFDDASLRILEPLHLTGFKLGGMGATPGRIDLESTSITDDGLRYLTPARDLDTLDLSQTRVTDEGLKHVGRHKQLRIIDLSGTSVTGPGLKHLKDNQAAGLILYLNRTPIDDEGLKYVGRLENLLMLSLDETPITGSGLAHLSGSEKLDRLELDRTALDERSLRHIGDIPGLEILVLRDSNITDEHLKHLTAPPTLNWLYLEGTRVSDEGLACLASIRSLSVVHVWKTCVTDVGVNALVAALPKLDRIRHRSKTPAEPDREVVRWLWRHQIEVDLDDNGYATDVEFRYPETLTPAALHEANRLPQLQTLRLPQGRIDEAIWDQIASQFHYPANTLACGNECHRPTSGDPDRLDVATAIIPATDGCSRMGPAESPPGQRPGVSGSGRDAAD